MSLTGFQKYGNTIAEDYPDDHSECEEITEVKPLSEAKWNVEIKNNGRRSHPFYWYATTTDNVGMGMELLQDENSSTNQGSKTEWEYFAKINGIKNYKYKC